MAKALIPGSFDPMTVGHIDLIERAASVFDEVTVAIMVNDKKKYFFSMQEREQVAVLSLSHLENVSVISSSGWLYELFDTVGADAIVKGIRNHDDLIYENGMASFNLEKNGRAQTLYITAKEKFAEVSSSAFRFDTEEGMKKYISPRAYEYVKALLEEKKK